LGTNLIRNLIVLTVLVISGPLLAQPVLLERIVAIVDDDVILSSEFESRIIQVKNNLERQNVEMPSDEVLTREILDRLILERIQLQMAERAGVRISDAELNSTLTNMARQNGLTLEQFRSSLESEGESYEIVREQIRQDLILRRVQQGNVRSRIQVTEQEVDDYLSSEEGQKKTGAVFRIAHLLLPIPGDAGLDVENAAMKYIEGLRERIAEGDAFERYISAPEQRPYPLTGGDLGWRRETELPGVFVGVVPDLAEGEVSAPVRSPSGLHLVKLVTKRGGSGQLQQQTSVRHILVKPSEIRTNEQARSMAESLRDRVKNGDDFAELAREFSEDIGSAREGGELGWTTAGQIVPEFEEVMNQTGSGEVSSVFQTQFGWHFLEVIERREQDISEEMQRNQARNILYGQKYDEELENWFVKIRDEAFVEIKL